jgi:hypothetical protein
LLQIQWLLTKNSRFDQKLSKILCVTHPNATLSEEIITKIQNICVGVNPTESITFTALTKAKSKAKPKAQTQATAKAQAYAPEEIKTPTRIKTVPNVKANTPPQTSNPAWAENLLVPAKAKIPTAATATANLGKSSVNRLQPITP